MKRIKNMIKTARKELCMFDRERERERERKARKEL